MKRYPILQKAHYDNPGYNVVKPDRIFDNQKKTLVVLNTYIPEGLSAWYNSSDYDGACTGYNHNRLESLKFTLDCYKHYKAGADYDLIVVDNNSPPQNATLNLFESLDVHVYIRENTYYSFGAYK